MVTSCKRNFELGRTFPVKTLSSLDLGLSVQGVEGYPFNRLKHGEIDEERCHSHKTA